MKANTDMDTVKFTAKMFVVHEYPDVKSCSLPHIRLDEYISMMAKNGITITKTELIKQYTKAKRHDGYGIGNIYSVEGVAKRYEKRDLTLFQIYHNCRVDYWCVSPVLLIKLIKG